MLQLLSEPIGLFARRSERRIGISGIMRHWQSTVIAKVTEAIDDIPLGAPLHEQNPTPYDDHDERRMNAILNRYQGHGVVCTPMDKAANTMVFR